MAESTTLEAAWRDWILDGDDDVRCLPTISPSSDADHMPSFGDVNEED